MIKSKFLAVGVMSGTSMDGIDISLILSDGKKSYKHIKSKFYTYKQSTKTTLSKFVDSFTVSKHSLALLRRAEELVTSQYIAALKKFLKDESLSKIDLISLHGQTIFHDPINKLSMTWNCAVSSTPTGCFRCWICSTRIPVSFTTPAMCRAGWTHA